ncbi:CHAP domain-containing protein [Paraburkholderia sediminicola]|uniref:CHAP domain-containing protein n=1 Tax=Paraburkholderia sediminicola TaxID=458836 RepID=UPI0038B7FD23
MTDRRTFLVTSLIPMLSSVNVSAQANVDQTFVDLKFPPFGAIGAPEAFGYEPATAAQRQKALEMINQAPMGPKAIDIAQYFIDKYAQNDSELISQWPAPANWNPLVVDFFSATTTRANNDMIAWCAAFANWCLERNGKPGTKNAASQSFLDTKGFNRTAEPKVGDLAVFTCYDLSGKTMGLGHVAFVKTPPANGHVVLVGGNTSSGGHSSTICEKEFLTGSTKTSRTVGNKRVPCVMRLNTYIQAP